MKFSTFLTFFSLVHLIDMKLKSMKFLLCHLKMNEEQVFHIFTLIFKHTCNAIMLDARNGVVTRMCSVPTNMKFRICTCLINCSTLFHSPWISTHLFLLSTKKKKKNQLQSILSLIKMDTHNPPNQTLYFLTL